MADNSKTIVKEINIKTKKKSKDVIDRENDRLLSAFSENLNDNAEGDADSVTEMDEDVLSKLKSRMKETTIGEDAVPDLIDERNVAINIAVVGVGQAGSRLAEEFYTNGYDVGVINTSAQDLEYINVTPNQKLLAFQLI